jgi:hypothetical protein
MAVTTVKLLINGEWVESSANQWHEVINPATQEVLARVPFATHDELNAAVAAAKAAFKTWRLTPIGTRARIFLKLQQLIRENMADLAATLTSEQGKTWPMPRAIFSAGWKWWSTPPISARCKWANLPKTLPVRSIPTRCNSRWACAPASRRSISRR